MPKGVYPHISPNLHPPHDQRPIDVRFWAKVDKNGPLWNGTACWEWIGTRDRDNYGVFGVNRHPCRAARVSYEWAKGSIPIGLTIDHLCRNRCCVNPDHLEAVTIQENLLRGVGIGKTNAQKTHCPKGHLYTEGNTYINHKGQRECRTCRGIHHKQWQDKQSRKGGSVKGEQSE